MWHIATDLGWEQSSGSAKVMSGRQKDGILPQPLAINDSDM